MFCLGSKNWENKNIFGNIASLTSDDYKNSAYYELEVCGYGLSRVTLVYLVPVIIREVKYPSYFLELGAIFAVLIDTLE